MTAHIFVSGFVQGVGFRQFVKRSAVKLGLTGWVKNMPDNRVEALFQSQAGSGQEEKEKLEKMISICEKGPFLSEVKDVRANFEETEITYDSFDIIS